MSQREEEELDALDDLLIDDDIELSDEDKEDES